MMYDRKGPQRQLGATLRLVFFAAAATSPLTAGAATCTVGAGVSTLGNEYFATAAYPDGSYEYQVTILLCSGGVPSYCSGTPFVGTPDAVIRAYRALYFSRVFRNQCGSMGLIPHDRFLGAINDGVATVDVSLAAHPLSATYTDEFVKGIAPGEDFPRRSVTNRITSSPFIPAPAIAFWSSMIASRRSVLGVASPIRP